MNKSNNHCVVHAVDSDCFIAWVYNGPQSAFSRKSILID